jgi:predicted alpha/beta hydrolase family esterase
MAKNAIILHGTGGSPDVCWYGWLRDQLEARGYVVHVPYFPRINIEPIETFLPEVRGQLSIDEQTVLVGHSAGAPLVLSLIEQSERAVSQTILVAGYVTIPGDESEPVLQATYDWQRIKAHAGELYIINSVTDPYGCDSRQGAMMFKRLGGTQIIRDDGHFGSPGHPYLTFPLLNKLIA